ncbi:FUSC family protein [Alicyclobacillus acidiphilus]|uniref:FUSC family protein n=1 Tax=Alicyclobacillus acidiphilus TaxID=182455 RepID=UPI0008360CF4|nr:aromatic acid exporter family protein [Alicyclobacillus acidiphilus]
MHVGARVIKTGIAVIFTIYLSRWFNLSSGVGFIVASSILAIQPSIYRSWRQLRDNLIANVIGATIAIAGVSLLGTHPIVIGLLIVITIAVNLRLRLESSLDLSLFVVVALVFYSSPGNYLVYAIHRFVFIMVGIAFATLINIVLFPPKIESRLFEEIFSIREELSLLLRLGATKEIYRSKRAEADMEQKLRKLDSTFELLKEERRFGRRKYSELRQQVAYRKLLEIFHLEFKLLRIINEFPEKYDELAAHIANITSLHEKVINQLRDVVRSNLAEQCALLLDENSALRYAQDEQLAYAAWVARDLLLQLHWLVRYAKHRVSTE